jgi:hypothetical protein
MSLTKIHLRSQSPRLLGRHASWSTAGAEECGSAPAANSAVDQVLVVAAGERIAPEGRGMYFSAVELPWYRLSVM